MNFKTYLTEATRLFEKTEEKKVAGFDDMDQNRQYGKTMTIGKYKFAPASIKTANEFYKKTEGVDIEEYSDSFGLHPNDGLQENIGEEEVYVISKYLKANGFSGKVAVQDNVSSIIVQPKNIKDAVLMYVVYKVVLG